MVRKKKKKHKVSHLPSLVKSKKGNRKKRDKKQIIYLYLAAIVLFLIVFTFSRYGVNAVKSFDMAKDVFINSQEMKPNFEKYGCTVPIEESVMKIFYIDSENIEQFLCRDWPIINTIPDAHKILKECTLENARIIDYSARQKMTEPFKLETPIPDEVKKYYAIIAICEKDQLSVMTIAVDAKTGKLYW